MSEGKRVILIGVPTQAGTHQKGCLMGPDALRTAGIAEAIRELGHTVEDWGNLTPRIRGDVTHANGAIHDLGETIGWIGELHPRWVQRAELPHAPIVFEVDATRAAAHPLPALSEISRQPVVIRDLAMWVPEGVLAQQMLDTVRRVVASEPELAVVKDVRLFDVWRDKSLLGKEKSLAFRFWLQDTSVTLDDARVESCLARIRTALETEHGARLRV